MVSNLIPWRRNRKDVGLKRADREDDPYVTLHRQWDRLFEDFFQDFEEAFGLPSLWGREHGTAVSAPSIDVSETETEYEIVADLPGLEEKDVELTLDEDQLIIKGEKKSEREEKKKDYHVMERSYGSFHRSLPLPRGIDLDAAKASFKKGVLTVTLPKTAEARKQQRVINVNAE